MSTSPAVNKALGLTDDLIGGSSLMWRYHHQANISCLHCAVVACHARYLSHCCKQLWVWASADTHPVHSLVMVFDKSSCTSLGTFSEPYHAMNKREQLCTWVLQVSHHIHCNDLELDEDVFSAFPFLRFDARMPRKWFHKYQHLYMVRACAFCAAASHACPYRGRLPLQCLLHRAAPSQVNCHSFSKVLLIMLHHATC